MTETILGGLLGVVAALVVIAIRTINYKVSGKSKVDGEQYPYDCESKNRHVAIGAVAGWLGEASTRTAEVRRQRLEVVPAVEVERLHRRYDAILDTAAQRNPPRSPPPGSKRRIKQKISGTFRTETGIERFGTIRAYLYAPFISKAPMASGELLLEAEDIHISMTEEHLSGSLRLGLLIRDGSAHELRFDISGSSLVLDGFQGAASTASARDAHWHARLQLEDTEVLWQKPMHVDV